MTTKFIPEQLYELGYTDLVSIIPPDAQLTPSSAIPRAALGKVPGVRLDNGLWSGYDWRKYQASADDVRRWCLASANVGMRTDHFPAVDIDCTDEALATIVEECARAKLGDAPMRIGRPPKRLLVYRTAEPFGRMRLVFERDGHQYLVEILGAGQQFVLHGIHPGTNKPYEWTEALTDRAPKMLKAITRAKAEAFLTELGDVLTKAGCTKIVRTGTGVINDREAAASQPALLAPSAELLREAVRKIPNTNELFPNRDDYVKMGYAIRAASAEFSEEGFLIYAEWAAKWEGNGRSAGNDPETVRGDWRRMRGPYSVGWTWIAEQARPFGFETATSDFAVLEEAQQVKDERDPIVDPPYSDQWLARRIVERRKGDMRFVPSRDQFLVWSSGMWQPDAILLAESIISDEIRAEASQLMKMGMTPREIQANERKAVTLCSAGRVPAVRALVRADRAIAVAVESLDHDPWVLNTPAGIVDLTTGKLGPARPDALCTKSTAVAPAFGTECPRWLQFLREATGGDEDTVAYLRRLCGYALTGSTREQQLTFIFGPGANGKSVFLNVLSGILGSYARVAAMDTFTASYSDKHTTDVAGLLGARLVTASETDAGKRWDEARLKSLTGGEAVTARFMRQDNFTFLPQFKLVFVGNHQPEIRNTDAAMRRRIHMVPFIHTPPAIDRELGAKLRQEWPAILAWMVQGCLEWQQQGLNPPLAVTASTEEYFRDEDAYGRWIADCLVPAPEALVLTKDLYLSWRQWANGNGEHVGSQLRMAKNLVQRKWVRARDPKTRQMGFAGYQLVTPGEFTV